MASMNTPLDPASVSLGSPPGFAPAAVSPGTREDSPSDLYEQARLDFIGRRYVRAAHRLEKLLDVHHHAISPGSFQHGTTAARLLLARAYYHSAQLSRAETAARSVLASDPMESYAALLLGRTLERLGRHDEAEPALRLARALGAPDLDG